MGNLSESRVTQWQPFQRVGVNFLRQSMIQYRAKTVKNDLCLFACFVTKAINLDVVENVSISVFLCKLKRFISRREKPADIYSDCGTHFKSAEKEMSKQRFHCNEDQKTHELLSLEVIIWKFKPSSASHFEDSMCTL